MYFEELVTERRNEHTMDIDKLDTLGILKIINNEDKKVAFFVEKALIDIAVAVEIVAKCFKNGGRLFYIGAGTSGRLAIVDASECRPTFGVSNDMVQGIIAGGNRALHTPVEDCEDNEEQGRRDIINRGCNECDVVMGLAASGRTPYVLGALKAARSLGAKTISFANNSNSEIAKFSDCKIEIVNGPEVIMGSTRMKAGTSQKMVLNMITTAAMIKTGKVYSNLMVDMIPTNTKLMDRAIRLIMHATGVTKELAAEYLELTDKSIKTAIVMIEAGVDVDKAKESLKKTHGIVAKAIDLIE